MVTNKEYGKAVTSKIEVIFMNCGSAILSVDIGDFHYHHCYDSMEQLHEDYRMFSNCIKFGGKFLEDLNSIEGNEAEEYTLLDYYLDTTTHVVDRTDFALINKDYGENARIFAELVENENSNHAKRRN